MSALVPYDLTLDAGTDFTAVVTITGQTATQLAMPGATAQLMIRGFAFDATPLITVSTTATTSGSLSLGVGLPAPVGSACTNLNSVEQLGMPLVLSTANPSPVIATVASLSALASYSTVGITLGEVAFVSAGNGTWYAWSPADTNPPNGSTIIATSSSGPAGNWLLCGTITITITAAAAAALVGFENATYDLLVFWPNGTSSKLMSGPVAVLQTITTR